MKPDFRPVALVMGLGECGLAVGRALSQDPSIRIHGFGDPSRVSGASRVFSHLHSATEVDFQRDSDTLLRISHEYPQVVPFAAGSDYWIRLIDHNRDDLPNFLGIGNVSLDRLSKKEFQLEICRKEGILIPNSVVVRQGQHLDRVRSMRFPVVVKPSFRTNEPDSFRILRFRSFSELVNSTVVRSATQPLTISEFVPGNDADLFTFGAVVNSGEVIADFYGRKLTQKPMIFGTAGVAESVPIMSDLRLPATRFLRSVRFTGITQIEFKRHSGTGRFFFIEMNPRAWLWIGLATRIGRNLPLIHYRFVIGALNWHPMHSQNRKALFVSGTSIVKNIRSERNALALWHIATRVHSHVIVPAVFSLKDLSPFLVQTKKTFIKVAVKCGEIVRRVWGNERHL